MINVQILRLIEGAKKATGLTVIIDVFRAISLECYLYDMGAREIRPIGTIEEAVRMRDAIPGSVLAGERAGKKCEGFDFGNSPCSVTPEKVAEKIVIHTTSAGTQGIINAVHADEIITACLANARAVADYILSKQPQTVSLVCMGNMGVHPAAEDELCAEYIKSIVEGNEMNDIKERIEELRHHGGEHFFDPNNQEVFPEEDFWLCTKCNIFPFLIKIEKDEKGFISRKIMPDFKEDNENEKRY